MNENNNKVQTLASLILLFGLVVGGGLLLYAIAASVGGAAISGLIVALLSGMNYILLSAFAEILDNVKQISENTKKTVIIQRNVLGIKEDSTAENNPQEQ